MLNWDRIIARVVHLAPVVIVGGIVYFAIFMLMIAVDVDANSALYWALFGALASSLAMLFIKLVWKPFQPGEDSEPN